MPITAYWIPDDWFIYNGVVVRLPTKRSKNLIVAEYVKKAVGAMSHMTPLSASWEFMSGLWCLYYRVVSMPSSRSCCETYLRYEFRGIYSNNLVYVVLKVGSFAPRMR